MKFYVFLSVFFVKIVKIYKMNVVFLFWCLVLTSVVVFFSDKKKSNLQNDPPISKETDIYALIDEDAKIEDLK